MIIELNKKDFNEFPVDFCPFTEFYTSNLIRCRISKGNCYAIMARREEKDCVLLENNSVEVKLV